MNSSAILILITFIIILAIGTVLLTPFISLSSDYGKFEENIGPCILGLQYIDKVCIPHSESGKGCLLDGRITYNTYRRKKECKNYLIRSDWSEPEYTKCESGKQILTKECVKINESGINNCFVQTSTETVYYSIGDVYDETISCINPSFKGSWVLLSPEYSKLPRNKFIPKDNIEFVQKIDEIYKISKFCDSRKLLEPGTFDNILACEYGDYIYISDTNNYCSGVPPDTLVNCRYLPENYPYYLLSLDNKWVVVEHLPGNLSQNIPFVNNISPGNFRYPDVELVISEISSSKECSLQDITRESAAGFIFIPVGKGIYRIGLNIGGGYPGVLILKDRKLFWRQSPIGPDSPGTDEGDIFEVSIDEINDIESRINFLGNTSDIMIKNIDSNQLVYFESIVGRKYSTNDQINSKDCSIYINSS